jgi:hypothetical protein
MPRPAKYIPYYDDIVEAMALPGCAFCTLQTRAAERYLDAILWESVNDPRLRREVTAARGFCRDHAWLLVRPGTALSSAIIYKDVVTGAARAVQGAPASARQTFGQRLRALFARNRPAEDAIVQALAPTQRCPVCINAAEVEGHLCATVATAMKRSDDFIVHFRGSAGLCLAHFGALIGSTSPADMRAALIDAQVAIWQALEADLAEFIRKTDYRFRHEKFGAERDAWERAIALTSGAQPGATSSRGGLTQTS